MFQNNQKRNEDFHSTSLKFRIKAWVLSPEDCEMSYILKFLGLLQNVIQKSQTSHQNLSRTAIKQSKNISWVTCSVLGQWIGIWPPRPATPQTAWPRLSLRHVVVEKTRPIHLVQLESPQSMPLHPKVYALCAGLVQRREIVYDNSQGGVLTL